MTTTQTSCPSFLELADYWTSDSAPADVERIEAHVFTCDSCARLLAEAEQLRTAIGDLARSGSVHALVTDAVLNQLARDGVRVRSYVLDPGETVHCAVWADDEVLVTRLRGNFANIASVDAEWRLESGEEWGRASDLPVRKGASELVFALPASLVRNAPNVPIRLTLRATPAGSPGEKVLAEYVFDHEGALDRHSRDA